MLKKSKTATFVNKTVSKELMTSNVAELLAKDQKHKERREKLRTYCYQLLIFLLCFTKLYYISLLQGVMFIQRLEFSDTDILLKVSFLVGMLLMGNVIDNISTPKSLSIAL